MLHVGLQLVMQSNYMIKIIAGSTLIHPTISIIFIDRQPQYLKSRSNGLLFVTVCGCIEISEVCLPGVALFRCPLDFYPSFNHKQWYSKTMKYIYGAHAEGNLKEH